MRVDVAGSAFEAQLRSAAFGPVALAVIQGRPHRVTRSASLVAEGDPDAILLYLVTRGSVVLDQDDRTCLLPPGILAFHDTSRPSSFEGLDPFEVARFSVPKRLFGSTLGDLAVRSATDAGVSGGRPTPVMAPFLDHLARTVLTVDLSPGEGEAAADMLVPMIRGGVRRRGLVDTTRVDAPVRDEKVRVEAAAGSVAGPTATRQGALRVHQVRTQAVRRLRHQRLTVDQGSAAGWRRPSPPELTGAADLPRGLPVGLPQCGQFQQGLQRAVWLHAERAAFARR